MKTLLDFLSQPWLGTIFGVLGLATAIIFYLRSRRVSQLAYQYDEVTLLGASEAAFPNEIEIRFSGAQVPCVTASRFVLWNAGNITLRGSDIVAGDPLRIELEKQGSILKLSTLKVTRDVNAIKIMKRPGADGIADIRFDYLDPGDGIALEALHSGGGRNLRLKGTLRGVPKGARSYGRANWFSDRNILVRSFPFKSDRSLIILASVIGGVTALYGLLRPQIYLIFPKLAKPESLESLQKPFWPFVIAGAFYAALALLLIWAGRRRYPSMLQIEPPGEDDDKHDR
jgi:hypothetical protein